MRRSSALLALVVTCAVAAPRQAAAQGSDSVAVHVTIGRMLEALRNKDAAGLRATFDSATRMTLLRPAPDGSTRVMVLSGEEFIKVATNPQGPALDEPVRNMRMTIDGNLATVWAEYQVRINGKVSHCGYDAFHLARLGGQWKILNVSDTFRQQGCGPMW